MIAKSFKEKDSIEIIDEELRDSSAINRKNLEEYEAIKKENLMKDREIASLKDHIRAIERDSQMLNEEINFMIRNLDETYKEMHKQQAKLNEKISILTFLKKLYG